MKRSEINKQLQESIKFFKKMNFSIPPWGFWSVDDWKENIHRVSDIVRYSLGWDITDFGSNDFEKIGLINFNLRNGLPTEKEKTYCEKIIIVKTNQLTPWHTHKLKIEDIINRGGGNLIIELQNSTDFKANNEDIVVSIDGIKKTVPAKGRVVLKPGESICLKPGIYHQFYGEKETVLVGEVSTVNDDISDNVFIGGNPRFPEVDEDTSPLHLLVIDYDKYLQGVQ